MDQPRTLKELAVRHGISRRTMTRRANEFFEAMKYPRNRRVLPALHAAQLDTYLANPDSLESMAQRRHGAGAKQGA